MFPFKHILEIKLSQIQEEIKYKLLDDQRIKINVDRIDSPPPADLKYEVFQYKSVNNNVIAPANTVITITTHQTNKVILFNIIPSDVILLT